MTEALSGLVGTHIFDEDQKEVFRYLVKQMRQCAAVRQFKHPSCIAVAKFLFLTKVSRVLDGEGGA